MYPVFKTGKYDFVARMGLAPGIYEYEEAGPEEVKTAITTRTYNCVYKECPNLSPAERTLGKVAKAAYIKVRRCELNYFRSSNLTDFFPQNAKDYFSSKKHHTKTRPARTAAQVKKDELYLLKELRRRGPFVLWARSIEYDEQGDCVVGNWLSGRIDEEVKTRYSSLSEEAQGAININNLRMPVQAIVRWDEFAKLPQEEQDIWVATAKNSLHSGTAP